MALLEVEDLTVSFYTEAGVVRAVDGLSYAIERGELFGVVGESGAGKSVAALALLGLIDEPGRIESGSIRFRGRDLLECSDDELRDVRGNEIAMVFQDAQAALDPVYSVGEQIAEAIRHHLDYDDEAARERAVELLDRVGIPEADRRYDDYPHEFSGGMQQRVVIAMALSCDPDLLIADEPTTALDVTTEASILSELEELAAEFDTAVQLITHDLGVVARLCDRVLVLYAGQSVEIATAEELFYDPKHPYTVGLLSAMPRVGDDRDRLPTIPGSMPDLIDAPPGCRFHPRCPWAEEACARTQPPLVDPETGVPVADAAGQRGARCLAYTGDLEGALDYEVHVQDEDAVESESEGSAVGAESGDGDSAAARAEREDHD